MRKSNFGMNGIAVCGILFVLMQNFLPIIFTFITLFSGPSLYEKVKLFSKMELHTGTPLSFVECKMVLHTCLGEWKTYTSKLLFRQNDGLKHNLIEAPLS